jgi:uncharacterized protein with HEPN domain
MNRDDAFLLDILRFSERAMRATNGRHLEELQGDEILQSALVHPLIVIGEAVKGLSGKFREQNTQNSVGADGWHARQAYPRIPSHRLGTGLESSD